jgi:hypothetical protein
MAKEPKRAYHIIPLFLLAFFGPFLIGYQYLEWFHDSSSHMTWFIATGIGSIENSDWTGNTWFLRTVLSAGPMPPIAALAFLAIFLIPRLLFAVVVLMYEFDRIGKASVFAAAVPAIAVTIWITLQMMTASIILGTPPGVLISIVAPDIDSRLFLPTPFLLVLGFIITRSKK